jgi:putative membrane protein
MLTCDGIIGWNLRRSFWQRRAGLLSLTATTAAGKQKVLIQDIGEDEAVLFAQEAVPGLLTPFLEVAARRSPPSPATTSAATPAATPAGPLAP